MLFKKTPEEKLKSFYSENKNEEKERKKANQYAIVLIALFSIILAILIYRGHA